MFQNQNIYNNDYSSRNSWFHKLFHASKKNIITNKEKEYLYFYFIDIIINYIEHSVDTNSNSNCDDFVNRIRVFYKDYVILAPNGSINNYFEYLNSLHTSCANKQIHIPKLTHIISLLKTDLKVTMESYTLSKKKIYKALLKAQLNDTNLQYTPILNSITFL